jgi:hypothetical protein
MARKISVVLLTVQAVFFVNVFAAGDHPSIHPSVRRRLVAHRRFRVTIHNRIFSNRDGRYLSVCLRMSWRVMAALRIMRMLLLPISKGDQPGVNRSLMPSV